LTRISMQHTISEDCLDKSEIEVRYG
jgi:hypothetical protein